MTDPVVDGSRACSQCGEAVPADRSVCPSCGQLRPAGSAPPRVPGWGPAGSAAGFPPPPASGGPGPFQVPVPPAGPQPGFGGPVPPGAWAAPSAAPPPRSVPPRKQRGWVAPLVVLVVLGAIAAGAVAAVQLSDDESDAAGKGHDKVATTTEPPTTTIPRVTQASLLEEYCNAPGLKWPEVPPHVPGEPDRTYTKVMDRGVDTASNETSGSYYPEDPSTLGGSTVISPHTDNLFTDDPSFLPRTRTVACVTLLGTENVGKECYFNNYSQLGISTVGDYKTMQLAQNRFAITVYELHSGGILHKGEILTPAGSCSPGAVVTGGDVLAWGLTDADVLAWFNSHFVDGKPA